jgi:hypothetical protein
MTVLPAEGKQHGVIFFGYDQAWQQGAVNDAGLFYDATALEPDPLFLSRSQKPVFDGNLFEKAMRECATVQEVIDLFSRYTVPFLANAQFIFADRQGDAAIIESGGVVRIQGNSLLATHFRQLSNKRPFACPRFQIAEKMLGEGRATLEGVRAVLAAVHKEGDYPTLYSNIYDLKRGKIYLYLFHNFEQPVVLDVQQELTKGGRVVALSSLFPRQYAFEVFEKRAQESRDKEQQALLQGEIKPNHLEAYAGTYKIASLGGTCLVKLQDQKLVLDIIGVGKAVLIPKPSERFDFYLMGPTYLTFEKDKQGKVTAFTVLFEGAQFRAARV